MTPEVQRLSMSQLVSVLLFGIGGWFAAAMLLRWLGPMGIYDSPLRFLVYALIIPGTLPVVWGCGKLAGTGKGQLFVGFSLATAMATVCDGVALAWFPGLYGASVVLHAGAGGTILWGVGIGIFLAYLLDRG